MTLLQEKPDQIEKESETTETQLDQDKSLTPSIVKEELTVVKGVGPRTKEILQNAGILSIIQLAQSSTTKLVQIGIGQATAKKIVAGAKEHIHKTNLDPYAQLKESEQSISLESEPVILNDDPFYNTEMEQVEDTDEIAFSNSNINISDHGLGRNSEIDLKNSNSVSFHKAQDEILENFQEIEHIPPIYKRKPNKNVADCKLSLNSTTHIIVDGSNIAWMGGDSKNGDVAQVEYIIRLKQLLENKGFKNIIVFCDYTLPFQIDDQKKLKKLINNQKILRIQSGKEADKYVLQYARDKNGYIVVHSEMYRDWYDVYGKEWIKSHRITVESVNEDFIFDPDIEVVENIEEDLSEPRNYVQFNEKFSNSQLRNNIQPEIKQEESPTIQEKVYYQAYNSTLEKLYKKIKSAEYFVIEKDHKLHTLFLGIDTIALKLIRVKEFLDIICIVPIIMSKMEGNFTISENVIVYKPIHENEGRLQSKKMAERYITVLKRAEETIFNDLTSNGELSKYIMKFLDITVSVERTITHKTLYLHSGPLEYEVLIEPIIVCKNTVGFTEKLIPFAYMKDPNLHIVNISDLSDLLSYLDQKYFLIETYSEKKNANTLNHEAQYNFANQVRLASIPFTIYGFTLLLIFLFQEFSLLSLLINIGYGLIGLYTVVISYIYLRLSHQKTQIKQEFAIPHHKRDLGLNNAKMRLIKEQLPLKLMEQFGYETLGKNSKSPVMEEVEQDSAQSFLTNKVMKKRVEEAKLFEEDTDNSRPQISPDAVDKYSSFLED